MKVFLQKGFVFPKVISTKGKKGAPDESPKGGVKTEKAKGHSCKTCRNRNYMAKSWKKPSHKGAYVSVIIPKILHFQKGSLGK